MSEGHTRGQASAGLGQGSSPADDGRHGGDAAVAIEPAVGTPGPRESDAPSREPDSPPADPDAPLHPLLELTRARLREFFREPASIFWTFGFPVLLAVGLGIAFRNRPPEQARVAVVGAPAEVDLVAGLLEPAESVVPLRLPTDQALQRLRRARVDLVLQVDRSAGGQLQPLYHLDPERPESRAARLVVDDALQRALGRTDPAPPREAELRAPGARYIDFLIPGLIGLNVMGSSMWGIGWVLVQTRRRRLLKRLAATPMHRPHYLLSHMLSRLIFLALEVGALLGFGWLVFDLQVQAALPSVAIVALLGSFCFMGLALAVAARTDNTEVASGLMNAFQLPMWVLSGSFFSYERFPELAHPFIRLLPLTAFNDALRALINEGAGLLDVLPQAAVLGGWGCVGFVVAVKIFRWQ